MKTTLTQNLLKTIDSALLNKNGKVTLLLDDKEIGISFSDAQRLRKDVNDSTDDVMITADDKHLQAHITKEHGIMEIKDVCTYNIIK